MPTASLRSALSRIPLGRALISLGLLLVAINIGSAIWDVRKAYERNERRVQRDFSNMTRLIAEQTATSLEADAAPLVEMTSASRIARSHARIVASGASVAARMASSIALRRAACSASVDRGRR